MTSKSSALSTRYATSTVCLKPDTWSDELIKRRGFAVQMRRHPLVASTPRVKRDCNIATGADSKIARQEQGESTWDPLNASELAPDSVNGLIPSLIAWAKSQPPGNVAIVSVFLEDGGAGYPWPEKLGPQLV